MHKYYDLMHRRAAYKVYWGGRGGAKSWAFAEALIRMARDKPLRILCLREYMTTLADSSHQLLKDTITRLGLDGWFTVTDKAITSRAGAEFKFRGMHGANSGIRSTEGIDIVWVEEAQAFSNASWRALIPTIRKDGSEIWISYNLMDEGDATHQIFVVKGRPDSIVHKINYDENPYMSAKLRAEMETDKAQDYELYEHIWLGMAQKRSNAIIFNGKYRVRAFDEDLWMAAPRLHFGADFGFADDPATLTRSFVLRNKLYIEYAAFGYHVDLHNLADFYDSVPGSREWPIKADCSAPATIAYMAGEGFAISGAEKWQGCVEDGIRYLRAFDEIIIHDRCLEMAEEAYNYRYKVDPKVIDANGQPLVLPTIVDEFNHGWDGIRYSFDGHVTRGGALGHWAKLAG